MIDPACGMNVEPDTTAGKHEYNGQTYFFCNHHCMAKFKEAPENFLKAQMHAHADHVHAAPGSQKLENGIYVCPMDPEVRESKPGACPKCGMALERETPEIVEYTCPMHPEIIRDQPGSCPICGMALERRVAVGTHEEDDSEFRSMQRRFWIGA